MVVDKNKTSKFSDNEKQPEPGNSGPASPKLWYHKSPGVMATRNDLKSPSISLRNSKKTITGPNTPNKVTTSTPRSNKKEAMSSAQERRITSSFKVVKKRIASSSQEKSTIASTKLVKNVTKTADTPISGAKKKIRLPQKAPLMEKRSLKRPQPSLCTPLVPSPLGKTSRPSSSLSMRSSDNPVKRSRLNPNKEASFPKSGNFKVQVAVRVRAPTRSEKIKKEETICIPEASTNLIKVVGDKKEAPTFNFDHVFGPEASQLSIFKGVVSPMIDEVIKGFNCTIFAYGQTGTGKTFTMEGNLQSESVILGADAGVIPRALHGLFRRLGEDQTRYNIRMSMLELYNEEAKDLLNLDPEPPKLTFSNNATNNLHIKGLEEHLIEDTAAGIALLQKGSEKRNTAATNTNNKSSRSHCIVTITVRMKGLTAGVQEGKLYLVDLAGSENSKQSGANNQRAREAAYINQSLLALGRVISALASCKESSSRPHIPYRQSKLTRILADSLGGGSKTCIIATVSPSPKCLEETIGTLKYASKAMEITNAPAVNKPITPALQMKELEDEVVFFRKKLLSLYSDNTSPATVNRLLREIQEEKDRMASSQVDSALCEAYAASESKLDSIATRLLLAVRESTQEVTRLREKLQSNQAQFNTSLKDYIDKFQAPAKEAQEELISAIEELEVEIVFHKGIVFRTITKLKDGLDEILLKAKAHTKLSSEADAHLSQSEAINSKLTQYCDELRTLTSQDQPPNDESWQRIKSISSSLDAFSEDVKTSSNQIQSELRSKAHNGLKLYSSIKKGNEVHSATIKEYQDADSTNLKSVSEMFANIRTIADSLNSKASVHLPKLDDHLIECYQPVTPTKSTNMHISLPDNWDLVDAEKIRAQFIGEPSTESDHVS